MKTEMSTVVEFEVRLKKHDWFYQMSDDSQVYRKGAKERKQLRQIADSSPEHEKLYMEYLKANQPF